MSRQAFSDPLRTATLPQSGSWFHGGPLAPESVPWVPHSWRSADSLPTGGTHGPMLIPQFLPFLWAAFPILTVHLGSLKQSLKLHKYQQQVMDLEMAGRMNWLNSVGWCFCATAIFFFSSLLFSSLLFSSLLFFFLSFFFFFFFFFFSREG